MESVYGFFLGPFMIAWIVSFCLLSLYLGYNGAPLLFWFALLAFALVGFKAPVPLMVFLACVFVLFLFHPLRRMFSKVIMVRLQKMGFIPKVSETERAALDAGTVWIERDIFSGAPNFKKLMNKAYPKLTDEEREFLDGPTERLCQMIDDWKIWKERKIPDNIWDFLKKEKFLGIIIPKKIWRS